MRTPPRPVHLHAALPQTACERIVLMLAPVAELVGQPERGRDQHRVARNAPPVPARSLNPQSLVSPFPSLLRHGFFISRVETGLAPSSEGRSGRRGKPRLYRESSNHHPKRRWQNVDRPALQRQHLAVHHHIHRAIKLKLDAPNRLPLRQRMPGVRAIIKCRQVPDQPSSPNWPPPHVLNQSVVGDGVGRDHHCAARELTIVKRQKQAAPRVKLLPIVESHRKRTPIEPRQTKKNRQQIPELPQPLKSPMPQRRYVRRKTHTQQIREVNRTVFVRESQNIASPRASRL